ncbi:MAG: hypothetical protein WCZ27_08385 [Tissierellaceae bacterium]
MNNNKILIGICAILLFFIGGFIWWNISSSTTKNLPANILLETPNTIPPSIIVDGEIYSSTDIESPIAPDKSEKYYFEPNISIIEDENRAFIFKFYYS